MTVSRVLVSATKLHSHRKGFLVPTRTLFAPHTQKLHNESMPTHTGVIPKETQVQNEMGGGLKGILTKLKEKVFSSPWSENTVTNQLPDSTEDTASVTTTEVIKTEERLDAVELEERKSEIQHLENITKDPVSHIEFIAACPTSGTMSNKSAGVSSTLDEYSECTKLVELEDQCPRSGADPTVIVASGEDQEAASPPLFHMIDRSVGEEERLGVAEHNELNSKSEPSADAQLVRQGNGYQPYNVDQGTVRCPYSDQEEPSKVLLHLLDDSVGIGEDTKASSQAVPTEEASIGHGRVPPEKKIVIHLTSDRNCEVKVSPVSVSSKMPLGLVDLLDDGSLTVTTSVDNSVKSSKDDTIQIKGLINQVKNFPKDAKKPRYDGYSGSIKSSFVSNGCPKNVIQTRFDGHNISHKREEGQSVVRDKTLKHPKSVKGMASHTKLFKHENTTNQVQHERQMKTLKEGSLSDIILQEKYHGRLHTCANVPSSDGDTTIPLDIVDSQVLEESASHSDDVTFDNDRSKPSPQIPLPSQKKANKTNPNPLLLTEKGRDQTDVLIRFVPKPRTVAEIKNAFVDCGPIDEIHVITSSDEMMYKDAYVRFKTKEGMRRALARTDPVVTKSDVIVEAPSLSTYTSLRVRAPSLIGISDIPSSLVRNPMRTVMVKGLTSNVSSCDLEHALAFCGGSITGFFMGSSNSVAYIEFETEDAKEKAIAAYSISISGSKLSILRIDSPNTTIVRVSNSRLQQNKLVSICTSFGKVKKVIERCPDVFDVHYKLNEWPAMVNILNSLNGRVVNGHQWIAQPATEIPLEILKYLWSQTDGRRQVHSVIQNLFRKIKENSMEEENSMTKVENLAAKYYEDRTELPRR